MYEHFLESSNDYRCKIIGDNGRTCDTVIKKKKSASAGGAASNLKRHMSRFHEDTYRLVKDADDATPAKVSRLTSSMTSTGAPQSSILS